MFITCKNIKFTGNENTYSLQSSSNPGDPFIPAVLNNPETYPVADLYRNFVIEDIEQEKGEKIESLDMEFSDIRPGFADLLKRINNIPEEELTKDMRVLKSVFGTEEYEEMPDVFKQMPFLQEFVASPITARDWQKAYTRIWACCRDILAFAAVEQGEDLDRFIENWDGDVSLDAMYHSFVRRKLLELMKDKGISEDTNPSEWVRNNSAALAAELLVLPSMRAAVYKFLLACLYTSAITAPQHCTCQAGDTVGEMEFYYQLHAEAVDVGLTQYIMNMLTLALARANNDTPEVPFEQDLEFIRYIYDTSKTEAVKINYDAHIIAARTKQQVESGMKLANLSNEACNVTAHIIEEDSEKGYRVVEVHYTNTDVIYEVAAPTLGESYISVTHTQEWNKEKQCWETTNVQDFVTPDGEKSTLFSGEAGKCMVLTDDRIESVLAQTMEPDADGTILGAKMSLYPNAIMALVAGNGENVLDVLAKEGNLAFNITQA
jgi:hypothetical protein